jgi:ribosomal protein S27E
MIAKLSNRQPGYRIGPDRNVERDQDGRAPLAVKQLTVVDVICPSCEHEVTMSYGGWSAITCQGCKVVLYRNSACEAAA